MSLVFSSLKQSKSQQRPAKWVFGGSHFAEFSAQARGWSRWTPSFDTLVWFSLRQKGGSWAFNYMFGEISGVVLRSCSWISQSSSPLKLKATNQGKHKQRRNEFSDGVFLTCQPSADPRLPQCPFSCTWGIWIPDPFLRLLCCPLRRPLPHGWTWGTSANCWCRSPVGRCGWRVDCLALRICVK